MDELMGMYQSETPKATHEEEEFSMASDPEILSVDRRWIAPDIMQEIVILAGAAWQIWLSEEGEIVAANKGAVA